MAYNFISYEPGQAVLLPPSIEEWVEDGSLARYVSDVIEVLEVEGRLSPFYERYREDGVGSAAYHPRMMVKVLVYSYCIGVTSSRKVAHGLKENVALRYLSCNQQPDHRSIADFRKNHLEALQGLFVDILTLCCEAGLVKLGRVALDGRRVRGNAALDQNRTRESLEKEIDQILKEAERVDKEEDSRYGEEGCVEELPEGFRTTRERLTRLHTAHERLKEEERQARERQGQKIAERQAEEDASGKKKRGRKPKDPEEVVEKEAKANRTDPDSRIMKTRQGFIQGYNGQAMAECGSQVIVAQDVTQEENDVHQLVPMIDRCHEHSGTYPDETTADAGYWSEDNVEAVGEKTELFVATTKDHKQRKACKEQEAPRGPLRKNASGKDRMERKLLTKRGKQVYRDRGKTIEAVFGQMCMRGLNRFLVRGIEKVRTEWSLWCTTHNILKLWRSGYALKPV